MGKIARNLFAKLWKLMDRPRDTDLIEAAWLDFQESWDWGQEPSSREIFAAGYAARQGEQQH